MARMSVEERRALLVDAAITVMVREGVASTTTRAIVAEAGMKIGVFHYCFDSKEELVGEVIRVMGRRAYRVVIDVLGRSSDPGEAIQLATRAYWADLRSNPLKHLLSHELTQYALRSPGHEGLAVAQYAGYYAGMEKLLVTVGNLGQCTWRTPVEQLAREILATVEGIAFQWLVSRDDDMTERLLDSLAARIGADAGIEIPAR